jgi:hypothetical protein
LRSGIGGNSLPVTASGKFEILPTNQYFCDVSQVAVGGNKCLPNGHIVSQLAMNWINCDLARIRLLLPHQLYLSSLDCRREGIHLHFSLWIDSNVFSVVGIYQTNQAGGRGCCQGQGAQPPASALGGSG